MNQEITSNFQALTTDQCGETTACNGYNLAGSYTTS